MGQQPTKKTTALSWIDLNHPVTKLTNNPNDRRDQHAELREACVLHSGDDRLKGFLPDNGEYEFLPGLGRECWTVDPPQSVTGPGCLGGGRGCSSKGGVPLYRRKLYKGNPRNCCFSGSQLDGANTCDPKYWGSSRFSNCDAEFTEHCKEGDRIFSDHICTEWDRSKQSQEKVNELKFKFCKGSKTMEDPRCGKWCEHMTRDARWSEYAKQCEIDKWQRSYCNGPNVLGIDDPVCFDYCDGSAGGASATTKEWCTARRKEECGAKKEQLTREIDQLLKEEKDDPYNVDVWRRRRAKQSELATLASDPRCGCYLPEQVYIDYGEHLKTSMGLQPGKHDLLINYIDRSRRCLFPTCGSTPVPLRSFQCDEMKLCWQNANIDITNSTIQGAKDISTTQTQNCFNELNTLTGCSKTPGEWTPCVDGKKSRKQTPVPGSTPECTETVETEECEATKPPGTEETPKDPRDPANPDPEDPTAPKDPPEDNKTKIVLGAGLGVVLLCILIVLMILR
jgi:hypothetical protein